MCQKFRSLSVECLERLDRHDRSLRGCVGRADCQSPPIIPLGRIRNRTHLLNLVGIVTGANHTVIEMQLDEIGPSLRYATAQVTRITRQGGPVYGNPASPQPTTVNTGVGGWSQRPQQSAQTQQPAAPPADDPWGAPAADQSSFGDFGKAADEPEF